MADSGARPSYALITGASQGLGKTFAEALAARKRNVILVARSKDKLDALARELTSAHGVLAEAIEFDLAHPGAGQQLADLLRERNLSVDLLVNNAGFGETGEFLQMTLDIQLQMMHLHMSALVELTYRLLPPMVAAHDGSIINISSAAGFQPIPYATIYAATKAFLSAFSVGIGEELRSSGIKVVTVCPGKIRPVSRAAAGQNGGMKAPDGKVDREDVVRDSLKMLDRGGGMILPGKINGFSIFAQRFIPRSVIPKIVAKLAKP